MELDVEKVLKKIREAEAKKVLIQLPDGLKPKAEEIQDFLKKGTDAEIIFWAGSNFGACDVPLEAERIGVDLIIHYGHSEWV